jgi:site-specific DNA-methyltransferase (adenine-specific)
MNKILFSSSSDEWVTPDLLYNKLNEEFKFDLDPCSTDENAKCIEHFTKEDNGLSKDWRGRRVFCNPPYSEINKWVEKAYYETCKDNTLVVMLIPSRTDTKYFHNFIYNRTEIRFIKGRLKFSNSKNSAPFPSMVVIFRGANIID